MWWKVYDNKYHAPDMGDEGVGSGQQGYESSAEDIFNNSVNDNSVGGVGSEVNAETSSQSDTKPSEWTPEKIAELAANAALQVTKYQQQQQNSSTLTEEQKQAQAQELVKHFNLYKPTQEQVDKLLSGGEEAVVALDEIQQAVTKQALSFAAYQMKQLVDQIQAQITPLVLAHQEQINQRLEREFFSMPEYKDLESYRPVLLQIRDEMIRNNEQFPTKEAAFAAVAKRAREVIAKLPGGSQQNSRQGNRPSETKQMQSMSPGGGGGPHSKVSYNSGNTLTGEGLAKSVFG